MLFESRSEARKLYEEFEGLLLTVDIWQSGGNNAGVQSELGTSVYHSS